MVEIVISVAAKIAEYLVAPVGRPFRYLWNYKTNLENLKNEVEKLEAKRDTVQLLIQPGEDPLPDVKLWREKANRIIVEVSGVVGDNPEQANIQCCKGFSCPNLMNRYQLSKKAADKLKDVVGLEQEPAKFKEVSHDPRVEAFESRKSILKDIIDALCDFDVNMVGIYGMGGVGKTTLARQVASKAKQHNLFDKIVFVEVSESPDLQNIQGVIADILGLQFKEETVPGRASRLCDQLKKEGKVLLILDNIWKGVDFEEVGIPFKNDHKGLKLLLTTRSYNVLTNQMESECNFPVHMLNEADAWSLFKNTAGTCTEQPNLQSIALEVAKECGGMPLAIVAIAKALKNKEEYAWKNALQELKNPSSESFSITMIKGVYTCIKLSYDYLDDEELQEIFLLCSRMGRTYDASIRDLFMYGLGLGFFKSSETLENAQCKVEDLVKKLKDSSLLLDAPNETSESHSYSISDGERFAMHDVICDVARSIAREKRNVCTVIDDVISSSWAKKNILKNCNSITLHNIGELPKDLKLVLPQLEFFYMKTKNTFSRITDDFFVEMSSLLVLHLVEMNLSPLPTSLSHLVNLQTLCLNACKLGDIADIGKLEKLEFLSFCGSEIRELPEEMHRLTSIRLLDLNDCSKLDIIPTNLLSCFTQLEALYMYNTLIMWEDRGLNIGRILDELKHLRDRLTTLEICIPNVKMSEGLLSPHLKRYKISIDRDRISPPKNSRTLRVKLDTNDNAEEVISQLEGIKRLDLVAESGDDFTDSKQSVSLDALFSLESLSLEDLNFEKICNVPLAAESFCQLRTITVDGCDKLTNIFSFSIDRVLPKLQEIEVSRCENMEGIFAIEREDDVNNSELIHEIQFSQLCSVTLRGLPQLKSFCHRVKTTSQLQLTSSTNDGEIISEDMIDIPKSLFNEKVVFPKLETLEISDIGAEKIWHNQLPTMSYSFQNLNRLFVQNSDNLKELFPSSMVNSFVQLQYLEISDCSLLEEVVFMEEFKEEERKDTQFPFLKEMTIKDCPNFKAFISNDKIGFPSLKAMEIKWCPKFKEFIFNNKVAVPNIEKLKISGMDNLEKIWHYQLANDSFCKFKSLEVYDCNKLLNVFPSNIYGRLLSLESLEVSECVSLEEIFDLRELSIYDSRIMLSFGNLQNLRVSSCGSLKNLFSASILAKEGVAMEEAHARFLFPKLTSLKLYRLPELRSFYPGRHIVKGPVLKTLELLDCGIHDSDEEGQMQQPFFLSLVEEAFSHLEELKLSGKEVTMLSAGQVPESLFDRLKILKVWDDESTVLQFGIIQRCQNLEELLLYRSSYKVIFPHGEDQTRTKKKTLDLFNLKDLKYIWKQNSKLDLIIQNLEVLNLHMCDSLINLMPPPTSFHYPSTSFQNLTSLKVKHCNSLINIGTSTVAKSLVQLTKMSISSCTKITEVIIGNHGDVIEDEIIFSKLESLILRDLPSLTSFCSWNFILNFPSLETLIVQCPNMKIFSLGALSTPRLHKLQITKTEDEGFWEGDLNTTVQKMFKKMVGFRVIENLTLSKFPHLKEKWRNQFPMSIFGNLKSLVVDNDYSSFRSYIFIPSVALELVQLQELKITNCGILEAVLVIVEERTDNTLFPNLNRLELKDLPKLSRFCNFAGNSINLPSLTQLWIDNCPKMGTFIFDSIDADIPASKENFHRDIQPFFDEKVVFPNLETLKISDISAEKIWHNQLPTMPFFFQNLYHLIIQSCDNLKELFSSSMVSSFVQLQYLEISECSLLEEVVFMEELKEEERKDTQFPFLKEMTITDCPNFKAFISNDKIGFPSLKAMEIIVCPQFKEFIFNDKDGFPSLEKMVISGMDNLESIWDNQFLGDSFYKLKSVEVKDCQELKTIFPSCICGRLSRLESLTVQSCGLVEEIFDLQSIEITTQLRELYVDHMSKLKRIWKEDPKGMLSYQKLQKVTVFLCPNLENLFPASVAKSLLNLVSLDVSDCGLLKEIIAKGGVKEAADRLLFPKLSSLQLHNLPQFRTFYTGQPVELSCLKRLGLHHCDNVKLFISEFLGFYETIELEGTNQRLPNLEALQLSGKAITMEWLDQVPGHIFRSLKSLELNDLESTVLPLHFIQKFGSLGKLSLNSSSYKEIFSYGKVKKHPQIKHLVLGGLFDLKQIWKQGLKIDPKFQNLEILEVRSCFNLINLMPSSTSFQNLRILQVWGCDGLKNLLTSSTAKSLVLLEELEVFDCKLLIEVVANDGAVTEEINFRKLKSLSLTYLQSLASFCSKKLNFPILESLVVNECPKMKIFSEGAMRAPNLHKLELNWEACEQSWEADVNTTIKQNMEKR